MTAPSLLSNSRWNLVAFAFAVAANFAIVPIVIRKAGLSEFGHAGLVIAAWAPLLLIGTVLGQAVTREIASSTAIDGGHGTGALAGTALTLCLLVAAGCALVFCIVGPVGMAWISAGNASVASWRVEFLAMAPGWLAQQLTLVLQGMAAGRQDFRRIAYMGAIAALGTVTCIPVALHFRGDAAGYLAGLSASYVLAAVAAAVLVRPVVQRSSFRPRLDRASLGRLLHFSRWQAVVQLAGTLGNQIDRYVLGAIAPAMVVGKFNAANRLQEAAYSGVMKAAEVLVPKFGAASGATEASRSRLYLLASWLVSAFSATVLAPMLVLADPMLRLWAGPGVADGGATLLRTLVLGGMIGCGSNVFSYYLMGIGRNAPLAVLAVIYSTLTILLSVLALRLFGPAAAGVGIAIASLVRVAIAMNWGKQSLSHALGWTDLVVSTLVPMIAAAGLAFAFLASGLFGFVRSWPMLALAYPMLVVLSAIAILAATAGNSSGRRIVASILAGRGHLDVQPGVQP